MIYVYAQYNSRTGNVYSKDFTQPPIIEHYGEVQYRGTVFEVWEKGETYAAARDKAMARLAVYLAKRAELYAKRAKAFADSSLKCSRSTSKLYQNGVHVRLED